MKKDRLPFLYLVGLSLVTAVMLILPCLYAGLTALAGFWVYYFAAHDFTAIWRWPMGYSRGALMIKTVCSVTPLLVGAAIAFSMVKPIFARRPARMQPLALDPSVEPRVYELVRSVCAAVGAPNPRRIEIDCDLNASARFDGGLHGFFSNGLILTLGMPLLAGLTQREMAGVIAHEFGHFRQRGGMRLSYLIRRVNGWFCRVVYERDGWDAGLASWGSGGGAWIACMAGCARFGVWLSRKLLWVLMLVGHAVSALLTRQMEYDADRAAILVAGSEAAESTMLKLAALESVLSEIRLEMRRMWRKQLQLPDNLPVLLEYRTERLPADRRTKIENQACLAKTGLLDTHPSTADRVRYARRLAGLGFEISDEPSRSLFENFDIVSRLVTLAHYEDDLNVPIEPGFLIPLEQLIRAQSAPVPASARVPEPVPMMRYDPSAFQKAGETFGARSGSYFSL